MIDDGQPIEIAFPPLGGKWPIIYERADCDAVPGAIMDACWAEGWRHFGREFYRYSAQPDGANLMRVLPLRIDLEEFRETKSLRRTRRRNADAEASIGPASPGAAEHAMFRAHKARWSANVPDRLSDFLGHAPGKVPCPCLQVSVRIGGHLAAASYLDLGACAASAVYGMFDPAFADRRLGIFTMLAEMDHARSLGHRYYYTGYATVEPSHYDYKKQFPALYYYDWRSGWHPISALPE